MRNRVGLSVHETTFMNVNKVHVSLNNMQASGIANCHLLQYQMKWASSGIVLACIAHGIARHTNVSDIVFLFEKRQQINKQTNWT